MLYFVSKITGEICSPFKNSDWKKALNSLRYHMKCEGITYNEKSSLIISKIKEGYEDEFIKVLVIKEDEFIKVLVIKEDEIKEG